MVHQGNIFAALVTDLSKAFNCLKLEFHIAKLNVYGLSLPALKLNHDYLSISHIVTGFHIVAGVSQRSILGPLLFNIFLADLFFIVDKIDIACFADANTPYVSGNNIDETIESFKEASSTFF